jgi:hypothetical protein
MPTMMMRAASCLSFLLLGTIQQSCGYTLSANNSGKSRRDLLAHMIVSWSSSTVSIAVAAGMMPANADDATTTTAVLSSKYCASGVGEGCNDLSEGNDLIRSLQEKSAMNREKYARVRHKTSQCIVHWQVTQRVLSLPTAPCLLHHADHILLTNSYCCIHSTGG